jgi:hypothetical protein
MGVGSEARRSFIETWKLVSSNYHAWGGVGKWFIGQRETGNWQLATGNRVPDMDGESS